MDEIRRVFSFAENLHENQVEQISTSGEDGDNAAQRKQVKNAKPQQGFSFGGIFERVLQHLPREEPNRRADEHERNGVDGGLAPDRA